jgi:hypothetical protein
MFLMFFMGTLGENAVLRLAPAWFSSRLSLTAFRDKVAKT